MALSGCAPDPTQRGEVTREMASAAKTDGYTDFLCWMLWEEPGCDLCEVLGWYGDGVCDEFCDRPDPDCAMVPLYGVPLPDGECWSAADCSEDEQCVGASTCPEGAYCIVAPHTGTCEASDAGCSNAVDDDGDGAVDCDDDDCSDDEGCQVHVLYAVPFEGEAACNDHADNDLDGAIDCEDSDCALDEACSVTSLYSVPFEGEVACDDHADNDLDGAIDCEDSDCAGDGVCGSHTRYAAPF